MSDEFRVELPESWLKSIKSNKLKDMVADEGMWFGRPSPKSRDGRNILKFNEPLFKYCETLDDFDYAFEPVDDVFFEMLPIEVNRQGVGISVDPIMNALEVDLYFFPCDYSEDENRRLPMMYVKVPIVTVGDVRLIDEFVKKFFPGDGLSAAIPFSLERVAELEGNFIDEYDKTEEICCKAVEGGTAQEIKNCERFLDFIRIVGKR